MKNFNLANFISILRIILIFPLIILLQKYFNDGFNSLRLYSFLLVLLIAITDFLDGFVARKMNQVTNLGKALDPIADKICLMAILTFLTINKGYLFLIFFVLLSIRDIYIIIIVSYLINIQKEVFQSNISGKWFIGISTLMLTSHVYLDISFINNSLYVISLLLMVISTYEYTSRYLKVFLLLDKND